MPPVAISPNFVLASGSPRRRVLLRRVGFDFTVVRPDVAEIPAPDEEPGAMAARLAEDKATTGADSQRRGSLVLGADTVVVLDGRAIGKPRDEADAVDILRRLGGSSHDVVTGFCLARAGGAVLDSGTDTTTVVFRGITAEEAVAYVATGEPLDKAGAYAIQGYGRRFVAEVRGSFTNVMGLPMERIEPLLAQHGIRPSAGAS